MNKIQKINKICKLLNIREGKNIYYDITGKPYSEKSVIYLHDMFHNLKYNIKKIDLETLYIYQDKFEEIENIFINDLKRIKYYRVIENSIYKLESIDINKNHYIYEKCIDC